MNGPQVDDSKCSFPCEANKSEICGGNDELSIWQDPTFPKGPDDTTVDSYKSLGCYTDKGPGRKKEYGVQVNETGGFVMSYLIQRAGWKP